MQKQDTALRKKAQTMSCVNIRLMLKKPRRKAGLLPSSSMKKVASFPVQNKKIIEGLKKFVKKGWLHRQNIPVL